MISAVVLTHNDAKTVEQTLKSITWCDEIVVVDDNSTDNTVSIAKKYTNKIYQRNLNDDFASQRNFGLSKARGDWLFFADSDEIMTDKLAKEIQLVVASRNDNIVGYFIKRRDVMWGIELNYGEQGRMKLLRLARKDAGTWERPVHEVWRVKGDVGELKEPLLHFPHPNVAQYLKEIDWYSTLNAQYLFKQKIGVSWWQIVTYPLAKFFLNYFLRLGFLDGTAGAQVAIMMSFHSFLTRAKLWQLYNNTTRITKMTRQQKI